MDALEITGQNIVIQQAANLRATYRIGQVLGEGGFGKVKLVTDKVTGETKALKIINKRALRANGASAMIFNEVAVLQFLTHPNILHLHEFSENSRNYFLITECCPGGELLERITTSGAFSEATAARFMRQILSVVAYCHDNGIAHRDLKLENFLLDSEEPEANLKVIDFGLATRFQPGRALTECMGTIYYMPPEVLKESYDCKCDVWSAGVVLYMMLAGYPPFDAEEDSDIVAQILEGTVNFPSAEWDCVSEEAKDLVLQLLTYDPEARPSAREALAHPWFELAPNSPLSRGTGEALFAKLQGFKAEARLQRAALAYVVSQLVTKEERDEQVEAFKSLDTDLSGTLSRAELIAGYASLFGEVDDVEAAVDQVLQQVDADASGEIGYTEFVAATLDLQTVLSEKRLRAAFDAFDTNGNGVITATELKKVLCTHRGGNNQIWKRLVEEADLNRDGRINFQEFKQLMSQLTA